MLKKQIEFAAHYVVNEFISQNKYESFGHLYSYQAFAALFKQFNSAFDIAKFNKRIETLLTK